MRHIFFIGAACLLIYLWWFHFHALWVMLSPEPNEFVTYPTDGYSWFKAFLIMTVAGTLTWIQYQGLVIGSLENNPLFLLPKVRSTIRHEDVTAWMVGSHVVYWFVYCFIVTPLHGSSIKFFEVLGGLGIIVWFFLAGPIYMIFVAFGLPSFFAGLIHIFSKPKTLSITSKHAVTRRPSNVVEAELAKALSQETINDQDIRTLIHELPVWKRWTYRMRYRSEAAKQKDVYTALKAQQDAMRSRRDAALAAHDLEREKRRYL